MAGKKSVFQKLKCMLGYEAAELLVEKTLPTYVSVPEGKGLAQTTGEKWVAKKKCST